MQNAQAPTQVKQAFDDVVKAREDSERFKNEAETYSNDVLPRARGQSARILEEANAYKEQVIAEAEGQTSRFLKVLSEYEKAPEITRKRIYIDSMESVLENSGKVIIDTKSSNNMLYLPLDRMRSGTAAPSGYQVSDKTGSYSTSSDLTARNKVESTIRDNLRRREAR
jgi:membrane protease subunit HflK